jgi:hypothetical protein
LGLKEKNYGSIFKECMRPDISLLKNENPGGEVVIQYLFIQFQKMDALFVPILGDGSI